MKMDLKETGREDVYWIHLAQGTVAGSYLPGNESSCGSLKANVLLCPIFLRSIFLLSIIYAYIFQV
jgi:hypothetical protein